MSNQLFWLASNSPRRTELLNSVGIAHKVLSVPAPLGPDEPILENENGADYVLRTALTKGIQAWQYLTNQQLQPLPILTADTTVLFNGKILGKASNEQMAQEYLQLLSGQTHEVRTAVVLTNLKGEQSHRISISRVSFCSLQSEQIKDYVKSHDWVNKAGAYGIQGKAAFFIQQIEGSYSGVMGLPLHETYSILTQAGFNISL